MAPAWYIGIPMVAPILLSMWNHGQPFKFLETHKVLQAALSSVK